VITAPPFPVAVPATAISHALVANTAPLAAATAPPPQDIHTLAGG
jgi:hypothetical protein